MNIYRLLGTVAMALLAQAAVAQTAVVETEAERLLRARSAEFERAVIKVSHNVYTAVGYAVSPVSMIVGDDGLIIVDTGMDTISGKLVREDFRDITDKPVRAIIFTHSHGDHTGGVSAFMDSTDVQIWAREGFGHEGDFGSEAGLRVGRMRGARQGGFLLKPEQRINNGIAQAYWPKLGGKVFANRAKPTHLLRTDRKRIEVEGVDIDLVAATGETYDQLYVWLPEERVAFAGDNFYKSWPNLYPIRGSAYRDVRQWADALDRIAQERPAALVGGHTRPIIGEGEVAEVLGNYRDAIRFVLDKTIEGMNKGMTPDQLVQYVQLPKKYRKLDYLKPYYGHPEWAVRSIFNGYLGWFDGNPTSLFPLTPADEAGKVVALAGGTGKVRAEAAAALKRGEAQWAAQLSDYLIALDPDDADALLLKADALEALARELLTATGRNYYNTTAMQLRARAKKKR